MATVDQQLEELRQRLSSLEEENRALKAQKTPAENAPKTAPQPEPEGARMYSTGLIAPAWILPSAEERNALKEIVFSAFPSLKPSDGRFADLEMSEFDRGFELAMHWLAVKGRGPLDTKHACSWWIDDANSWCREANMNPSVTGSSLLAACVAWGDVDFVLPLGHQIGLMPYGWREPMEAAWRKVLTAERLRAPSQPVRSQTVSRSIVRIDGQQGFQHQTW